MHEPVAHTRWRGLRAAWLGCLAWAWAALAAAHPMPQTQVWVDTTPTGLTITLQMPLNGLDAGFGQNLTEHPQTVLARHGEGLSRYLLQHVGARSGNQGWQTFKPRLTVQGQDASAELHAVMELRAPAQADTRQVILLLDPITHEVRTHKLQVFLRQDWQGGFVSQPPRLLGELDTGHNRLDLALGTPAPAWAGVWSLVRGGAEHIAEGTDHLLFLLMLLLAAPLATTLATILAAPLTRETRSAHTAWLGRWGAARPLRSALRHTAWVVTAFTLGHSLTLALGSTGWVSLPSQWVEMAVAATIAVAAVHACRPVFANAEAWMALGFGLVHGMAFSASLSGAGLGMGQHAVALLSFNLGIELMQLALMAGVVPCLLVLARTPVYTPLRWAGGVLGFAAATAWLAERGLGWANPVGTALDAMAQRPLPLWVGLLALTAMAWVWLRRRHTQGHPQGHPQQLR